MPYHQAPVRAFFSNGRLLHCGYDAFDKVADAALFVADLSEEHRTADFVPANFHRVEVPFFEQTICLAHRGTLHVYDEPKRSLSTSSGAVYLARSADKDLGWLLQLLPPWAHTSRHHHALKTERFINLAGSCLMGVGEKEVVAVRSDQIVEPETSHYLRTLAEPALNLLIISGHPDPLSMDDHHYEPFPLSFPR